MLSGYAILAPTGRETEGEALDSTPIIEDDEIGSTTALERAGTEEDGEEDSEQAKNITETGKIKANLQFI